jgi:hypothetical protein
MANHRRILEESAIRRAIAKPEQLMVDLINRKQAHL